MVKKTMLYAVEVRGEDGQWSRYVMHLMSAQFAARMLTHLTLDRGLTCRRVSAACMLLR